MIKQHDGFYSIPFSQNLDQGHTRLPHIPGLQVEGITVNDKKVLVHVCLSIRLSYRNIHKTF